MSISKEQRERWKGYFDESGYGIEGPDISRVHRRIPDMLADLDAADSRIAEQDQLIYDLKDDCKQVDEANNNLSRKIGELQAQLENVSEVYLEITNGQISKPSTDPAVVLDYTKEANEADCAEDLQAEVEKGYMLVKNRDNKIRHLKGKLADLEKTSTVSRQRDQLREQGQYIESLKVARERDSEKIGELEAEVERLDYLRRYVDAVDGRLMMKATEAWLKKEEV